MKYDIGDLLSSWPFDPDEFIARRITAKDGTEKVQIRIDMGMLQLEMQGRPDGQRPHGCDSLLEFYDTGLARGDYGEGLDEDACEDLFQEAWQFYQRYLSLFYLEDYAGVVRDTEHNQKIFKLVEQHADNDDVKWYFEQYYPHAIMMRARSRAMISLEKDNYRGAMREVERGTEEIEAFLSEWGSEIADEDLPELSFLRDWHEELEKERPLSRREQLERDLTVAVEAENFEEAARLRDKLRTMRPAFRGSNPERSSST
ncbi:UvrB/UvrC motif-containing protein [Candidatus Latescibacterota bacterium]